MRRLLVGLALVAACGDDSAMPDAGGPEPCLDPPGPFDTGDADGHADPLGASATEARAGRLDAGELPAEASGLLTWAAGDFVLANDKIAVVIEDVGESDLYDPWGGRPVGIARVVGGALVEPGLFGEQFIMTGRSTVLTTSVTVMNDGSNGEPAVIRAAGRLAPMPFLNNLISALYFDDLADIEAAIDYTLAPGAEQIEISMHYASPRPTNAEAGSLLHGFMYTDRFPAMAPDDGFTTALARASWVSLVDDDGTGWAYRSADGDFQGSFAASGFVGTLSEDVEIPRCSVTDRLHARVVIGGPGLDGLEAARRRVEGIATRTITGTVGDGTAMLEGVRVHAVDAEGNYLTRAPTDATGAFSLNVPEAADVTLTAYRRGWPTVTDAVGTGSTSTITMQQSGFIHVHAHEGTPTIPARIQVLPAGASTVPTVPEEFGESMPTSGRLHVEYGVGPDVTLPVPPGDWTVVVSHGYEYEIVQQAVTVTAGNTVNVDADLVHVVDTTGVVCGDFHIHTFRSNDSGDDAITKLKSAVADGLEIPVRTDHEWVNSFQPLIDQLGLGAWAMGIGSIEMTSFQIWGHMGVFPLDEDLTQPNAGAPRWQTWPTADSPDDEIVTLSPRTVFDNVRARPEAPVVIINHPHGGTDYFTYVGLDPATGQPTMRMEDWDEEFKLVEVFNSPPDWLAARDTTVAEWFGLLNAGRKVFAVGSSDSHSVRGSPVGHPRTCVQLGTDTPSAVTANQVRDQLSAGHASVSGGIYVGASVGGTGPGDTATGTGPDATVSVTVQAATWVDVDAIDVVVDGVTVQTIPVTITGAVDRYTDTISVPVAAGGSWVVIAAYGDAALAPVHPGQKPFGVTQPIFLER